MSALSARTGKVVVAMSGGVDSSVAAALLAEQGYEVIGLYMCTGVSEDAPQFEGGDAEPDKRPIGCCSPADAADARAVAHQLGIGFYAINFSRQFDGLIEHFADEYLRGRTPNPCILCNRDLKFGRLADYGKAAGADFIATGHYARIDRSHGMPRLRRGVDRAKDQSYVLFGIDREQMERTLFPLGELTKQEVRAHARRLGLKISDKGESQDICFAPDRDYARIVRERRPEGFQEGPIFDERGSEVGRHAGLAHFTVGQRRGLGVAMGKPYYVTALDTTRNAVLIGPEEALNSDYLEASDVRWLIEGPTEPLQASVQIRYTHAAASARIEPAEPDRVRVHFDTAQRAITPGQAAVFYEDDVVLGGGVIETSQRL